MNGMVFPVQCIGPSVRFWGGGGGGQASYICSLRIACTYGGLGVQSAYKKVNVINGRPLGHWDGP